MCEEVTDLLSESTNLRKATTEFVTSFCPSSSLSVCPSECNNSATHLRISGKLYLENFDHHLPTKCVFLIRTILTGILHELTIMERMYLSNTTLFVGRGM